VSSARRRFSVTVPDWGQDHLSSDAIVAYVDNELAAGPHARATRHLAECPECAAQVRAQGQARSALRHAGCPSLPSSLLSSLRSIPQVAELPEPPAGLAIGPDGQFVSIQRPELREQAPPARADLSTSVGSSRKRLIGAGAAVSGLALGALAFGVPGLAADAPTPTEPERGVFNGPVLGGSPGVVDARLQITPASGSEDTNADDVVQPADLIPGSFMRLR
jgi:anti-sigma factor RsiW